MDERGRTLFSARTEYFMAQEADGSCEMEPKIFSNALYEVCKKAAGWAKESRCAIRALSLTSQRSSVAALAENGEPLGNFIMWHDKRSAAYCDEMNRLHGEEIYSITGTKLTPTLSAPKMVLMRNIAPHTYDQAWKLVGIHDYLVLLITGEPVTDTSLASRSGLLDVASGNWSDRLLELFSIEKEKFCRLAHPGDVVGKVTGGFSGLTGIPEGVPVVSAGGDQQCSVLGQGITADGQIGVTVGTGAYACMAMGSPEKDRKQRVNLNAAALPGQWVAEASTFSSGLTYNWFRQNFFEDKTTEDMNRAIESVAPGCGGVLALPLLAGKGCPDWDLSARGVFCNFSTETSKAQFARAVLEGIAAEVAECIGVLRQLGDPADAGETITLAGGLAKSALFGQMMADMTGASVRLLEVEETTAAGAWIQAILALGLYDSCEEVVQASELFRERKRFIPDPDTGRIYQSANAARRLLYESIPFQKLQELLAPASAVRHPDV
ncbi:MAG: hypothetical protein LUG56_04160 [Lachnospiraceae bacterium]|nr:hypothetical protein [Lachnospiraceae bacterium]